MTDKPVLYTLCKAYIAAVDYAEEHPEDPDREDEIVLKFAALRKIVKEAHD